MQYNDLEMKNEPYLTLWGCSFQSHTRGPKGRDSYLKKKKS